MNVRRTRQAAVAGRFYPSDPDTLAETATELLGQAPQQLCHPTVVVLPHAGYRYSGRVAGAALADVDVPEVVLLLGPNHGGTGPDMAMPRDGAWQLPGGVQYVDVELAARLGRALPGLEDDDEAHAHEHSIEVELPLLRARREHFGFVPIVFKQLSLQDCERCGAGIAKALEADGRDILVIASTDMSHYVSDEDARRMDALAIDQMLALDPAGLYRTVREERISMCGVVPVAIALYLQRALDHAGEAKIVDYQTSGDVTGDRSSVVGYLGMQVQ